MSSKNKKALLIILIIIIASTALVLSQLKGAAAGGDGKSGESGQPESSIYQGSNDTQAAKAVSDESVALSLAKLLGALILVVAGIYGFLYLLRKMMGQKLSANRNHKLLEVLETTYVAQKKTVSLVRFSDRAVLIGIAESGINVLAELNPEETARVLSEFSSVKSPSAGFTGALKDAKAKLMSLNIGKLRATRLGGEEKRPQTA